MDNEANQASVEAKAKDDDTMRSEPDWDWRAVENRRMALEIASRAGTHDLVRRAEEYLAFLNGGK